MNDISDRYGHLPKNKAALLQRVEGEWAALERVISDLSREEMLLGGAEEWTIKDHLAHLMEWERYLRWHHIWDLPGHEVLGVDEAIWRSLDEDDLNAILFERNRARPLEDITSGLELSHAAVLRELKTMPFQMMMEPAHTDDPEQRPLLAWIAGNTYEHYREHRVGIERLRAVSSPLGAEKDLLRVSCHII